MHKRKTDYRETLGNFQIHMKDGREKFLMEVAKYYHAMYPARFNWYKTMLKRWNQVTANPDGSYTDAKGRENFVRIRVPTELWLFLQRWIPDWGKNSKDLDLLRRVWCDFAVGKDRRQRNKLFVTRDYRREQDCDTSSKGKEEDLPAKASS